MSKVLRAIVMWLVVCAIPLQGLAAAALPVCAAEHSAPATSAHAVDDQAMHAHADHMKGDDGHAMVKCCSVTCSMAASGGSHTVSSTQARPEAPQGAVASFEQGVVLDGPDRPPKLFLA